MALSTGCSSIAARRFHVPDETGPRSFTLKGKADRIDLLADGTFRVIDYKLGWPPDRTRALQLPVYALCAEQRLARPSWTELDDRRSVVSGVQGAEAGRAVVLGVAIATGVRKAQERLAETIDAIESQASFRRPRRRLSVRNLQFFARCAGRTTLVTSNPLLPFDEERGS